ncbi:hypothetical protein DFJ73DRAFT_813590, partial [Zopfochytrium polystomum]
MDVDPPANAVPFSVIVHAVIKAFYHQHGSLSPQATITITATSLDEFFQKAFEIFQPQLGLMARAGGSDGTDFTGTVAIIANAPNIFAIEKYPRGNRKYSLPGGIASDTITEDELRQWLVAELTVMKHRLLRRKAHSNLFETQVLRPAIAR